MKQIQKYLYWAAATLLLGALLALGFWKTGDLPRFFINTPAGTEVVCTYNAQDGNYYVFLPGYAAMEDVTIDVPYLQTITLDGAALSNGMTCQDFALDTPYELRYKRTTATLWFCQSANVATMYINTTSGTMDRFEYNKDYQEGAILSLYAADGNAECLDHYSTLKGRGNGTWGLDKRPYTLTLSSEIDLLGMGSASSWILLANAYDETNLNNKLVLDLAKQAGFQWAVDSAYVDVYLNGQYNGLYLLTEKVEVAPNRLQLTDSAHDFLGKIDLMERWDTLRNPFLTDTGRVVEVTSPKFPTQLQLADIAQQVNRLEQIIFSGEDLTQVADFDLDSWVRRYLIDEISGNIDSDLASSYFYYTNGVFFAGPVWDYDMTFGNNTRNQNPHAFLARNGSKSDFHISSYYPALYANPSFYQRMTEIYKTEFLPLLEQLLQGGFDQLVKELSTAAKMNSLRWGSMYAAHRADQFHSVETPEDVAAYLRTRVEFLNRAWLENTAFSTVQIEMQPGEPYWNISVETGSILDTSLVDFIDSRWICKETGAQFDPKAPISSDIRLTLAEIPASPAAPVYEAEEDFSPTYPLCLLSVFLLACLFLAIAVMDILHRRTDRRHSRNRSRMTL